MTYVSMDMTNQPASTTEVSYAHTNPFTYTCGHTHTQQPDVPSQ